MEVGGLATMMVMMIRGIHSDMNENNLTQDRVDHDRVIGAHSRKSAGAQGRGRIHWYMTQMTPGSMQVFPQSQSIELPSDRNRAVNIVSTNTITENQLTSIPREIGQLASL